MKQAEVSQRTKERLAASLKKCMSHKSLAKITVREIIEDCGLNRQTFYYHFHDIYDLLAWTFEQEAIELVRKSDSCLTWEDGLLLFFRYIEDNAYVCQCALDGIGRENLRRFFYTDAQQIVGNIVRELATGITVPEEYLEFLINYHIEALASTTICWLQNGMTMPPERLLQFFKLTVEGNITHSLLHAEAVLTDR